MFLKKAFSGRLRVCFIISVLCIFAYRLLLIIEYCSRYSDDDQALMWYGTALAGHFRLLEPHFLGQAYGSMLESVVAVPLYWLNVPLNICLPIATLFLWFVPIIICAIIVLNRNRKIAFGILFVSILFGWDYDVLTAIPRSFIPGFSISFLGIALMLMGIEKNRLPECFLGPILLAIGFVSTETTIAVIGIWLLYLLLYRLKSATKNAIITSIIGGCIGIIIIYYCNKLFYENNPEYMLHGRLSLSDVRVSIDVLHKNLTNNLIDLLRSFSVVNVGAVPIILLLIVCVVLYLIINQKEWKMLIVLLSLPVGLLLFLSLPKSLDFYDMLLFSQTRMFLFIPYCLIEVLMLLGLETTEGDYITQKKTVYFITAFTVVVAITKCIVLEESVLKKQDLYLSAMVRVSDSDDLNQAASVILDEANTTNCNTVVIVTDNRALGYATGAINYGKYISYNAHYDRRSSTYLHLKESFIDEDVLFVETVDDRVDKMYVEHITGNLISYLRTNKNLQRYTSDNRYYIR